MEFFHVVFFTTDVSQSVAFVVWDKLHLIPQKLHPVGKQIEGIHKSVTMKLQKGRNRIPIGKYEVDNEQNLAGRR